MSDPVQDAIDAATRVAAQSTSQASQAGAVVDQGANANAVATHTPAGSALNMDDLMMGSMSVDGWFKPKEYGLAIGDSAALFSKAVVMLDMTDGVGFVSKMAIKGGNPAQYRYTLDNQTAVGGGTWPAAQAQIRALSPTASPYRAVDLPFTVLEDIMAKPPGAGDDVAATIQAKAGQRLGYTTSTTNWANWEAFYREVVQAGLKGKKVKLEIGSQRRTNKANNVWGVMTFKLIGEVEAEAESE